MTAQGQTADLLVEWREYPPSGPLTAVTGVTITITRVGAGSPIVGPTSVGVTTMATGVNAYSWAIADDATVGDYLVLWEGLDGSSNEVTASETITVTASAGELYVSLATFKESLKIAAGNTDRDTLLTQALTAASRAADRDTGRRPNGFGLGATATRQYSVADRVLWDRSGRYKLLVDEIGSLTDLAVETGDGTTWTAVTDYRVDPLTALADSQPITGLVRAGGWGCDLVRVTAKPGWPTIPPAVPQAVLIQATRWYRRKDSPEGVAGGGEWGVVRMSRVDPDVAGLLGPLMLPGIA